MYISPADTLRRRLGVAFFFFAGVLCSGTPAPDFRLPLFVFLAAGAPFVVGASVAAATSKRRG
jgi:hypothetical protein